MAEKIKNKGVKNNMNTLLEEPRGLLQVHKVV